MEMVDQAMADFETAVKLKPDFSIACVQKAYTDYRHACATEVRWQLFGSSLLWPRFQVAVGRCLTSDNVFYCRARYR